MLHSSLLEGLMRSLISAWLFGSSLAHPLQTVLSANVRGARGAVSSESTICSQIGIDLMRVGGNAADAMVGTNLCVGVIGMYHSGIGGGGFMLVRDQDGQYESIDYRETAPATAFKDMYQGNLNGSIHGGLATAVPGELRGLEYLHKKHGVLPWRAIVYPSVQLAREGFNVTEDLVRYMASAVSGGRNFLVDDPVWAQDFAPNGTLLKLGDIITRKRYANTLEKIANHGAGVFYEGELAQSMVDIIQATNGTMTLDDLRSYKVSVRPPLNITYRGYRLFTTDAPSSGAVTLNILKTMEQFPLEDREDVNLRTHRFDEAMRFAYSARQNLGDPDYIRNVDQYEDLMLSEEKAKDTRGRIRDNETQPVDAYDPNHTYAPDGFGTSHIVVTDSSGLTITSTTTINLLFGAQIMTPDTGIILNNEMDDFSIPGVRNSFGYEPSPNNFVTAGKRPLSTITPVIAEHGNGTVFFATGAAGGSRIVSATAQTVWHVIEHEMSMHDAIAEPRLHDQLMPNEVTVEYSFNNDTIASLQEKGHNVTRIPLAASAVQGVLRLWDGVFEAASETRQKNSGGFTL
ncbi:hypothetical protein VTK73DRAFT_6384 [Phialemonium thermophilum]|uniref:Glutathione hydrolase n=1 Tax=Phialemonium thermophilum TaxID=223376 RepID=A0ABR3XWU3_9PEZI